MARLDLQNDPIKHKLYTKWSNMKQRCNNPKDPRYSVYGKRGINLCKDWMKFDKFYNDMVSTFKMGLTLDRIDSNKDYSKENCRWASQKIQQNNRTNNDYLEYKGLKNTLTDWASIIGVKQSTLWMRIYKYNWSIDKAFMKGANYGG